MNDFISFWQQSQLKYIIYVGLPPPRSGTKMKTRTSTFRPSTRFSSVNAPTRRRLFCEGQRLQEDLLPPLPLLLHLHCRCDWRPQSQVREGVVRFIHVTVDFINALYNFLRMHAEYSKYLYIKVIKKIRELFIYSIKLGPRDPLIKKNGDTFIRYPKQVKKLTRDNYSPAVYRVLYRF